MISTDPSDRESFITGLRELADYLDAHSGVPVPNYGVTISMCATDVEDGGRAEIDHISSCLGAPVSATESGTLETFKTFGSVTYTAFAVTKASIERYQAQSSYYGCVSPDCPVLTCPVCGSEDIRETRTDDCDAGDSVCACTVFSCGDCASTWRPEDA